MDLPPFIKSHTSKDLPPFINNHLLTKYERDIFSRARCARKQHEAGQLAGRRSRSAHYATAVDSPFDIVSIEHYLRRQCQQQEQLYIDLLEARKRSSHTLREKIMKERYPLTGPLAADESSGADGEERPRSAVFTPIHKLDMPKICPKFLQRNGLKKQLAMMDAKPYVPPATAKPKTSSSSSFSRRKYMY